MIKYLDLGPEAARLACPKKLEELKKNGVIVNVCLTDPGCENIASFCDENEEEVLAVVVSQHENRVTWQLAPEKTT